MPKIEPVKSSLHTAAALAAAQLDDTPFEKTQILASTRALQDEPIKEPSVQQTPAQAAPIPEPPKAPVKPKPTTRKEVE